MDYKDSDKKFMRRALRLAGKGAGFVSPNPMVGAVLVKNGKVIGEGYHEKFGQAHAEVNAIESASSPAKGATLYCNLEPCCHVNKKTPPCAQRIIKEKIARVVIASQDPNPAVSGNGISLLEQAGITISSGLFDKENRELNRFFFKHMLTGFPYVTLKIAQTLDGKIALNKGAQTWITNQKSQKLVHSWRSEYDAILVGGNTVRVDNPALSVRHVKGRNPKRIILSNTLNFDLSAHVFTDEHAAMTIVLTTEDEKSERYKKLAGMGINIHSIQNLKFISDKILKIFTQYYIASLLVEGGQQMFSQFLSSGSVDEVQIFISPKIFGQGISAFSEGSTVLIENYFLFNKRVLDSDVLLTFRKK
jgi:diaminohydroxyphosphoribosylaminopyrimidine deaminase / 5-amino-6-(5-phosphoribosylamino)uracil reductase